MAYVSNSSTQYDSQITETGVASRRVLPQSILHRNLHSVGYRYLQSLGHNRTKIDLAWALARDQDFYRKLTTAETSSRAAFLELMQFSEVRSYFDNLHATEGARYSSMSTPTYSVGSSTGLDSSPASFDGCSSLGHMADLSRPTTASAELWRPGRPVASPASMINSLTSPQQDVMSTYRLSGIPDHRAQMIHAPITDSTFQHGWQNIISVNDHLSNQATSEPIDSWTKAQTNVTRPRPESAREPFPPKLWPLAATPQSSETPASRKKKGNKSKGSFECLNCHNRFKSWGYLVFHYAAKHDGGRRYRCLHPDCDHEVKEWDSRSSLIKHHRKHPQNKTGQACGHGCLMREGTISRTLKYSSVCGCCGQFFDLEKGWSEECRQYPVGNFSTSLTSDKEQEVSMFDKRKNYLGSYFLQHVSNHMNGLDEAQQRSWKEHNWHRRIIADCYLQRQELKPYWDHKLAKHPVTCQNWDALDVAQWDELLEWFDYRSLKSDEDAQTTVSRAHSALCDAGFSAIPTEKSMSVTEDRALYEQRQTADATTFVSREHAPFQDSTSLVSNPAEEQVPIPNFPFHSLSEYDDPGMTDWLYDMFPNRSTSSR